MSGPGHPPGRALQRALRERLASAGDPDRAVEQQRYMKSPMPFAGVAMPVVRRLARGAGRQHVAADRVDFEAAMRLVWDGAEVREERYAILEITGLRAYAPWQDPDLLPLYRHFVVTGAWWDLVDDVATHRVGPIRRAFPDETDPLLRRWADDADLWLRRTAVLSQVGAKDVWDPGLMVDVLAPNLARREFFLRKAVGWALRDASARHPDWVRAYVDEHRDQLSPLSLREATRRLAGPPGPASSP